MIRYHARWVVPVTSPPIRDGIVAVSGGRIAYVGPRDRAPEGEDRDLGDAALVPGLVNAHTHLELTAFRGLLEGLPFPEWIRTLQAAKTEVLTRDRFLDAACEGIAAGLRAGITTYADTCDSGVALEAMRTMGVRGIMYQEVFGPHPGVAPAREAVAGLRAKLAALEGQTTERQRLGVSPHAPYTVSDELYSMVAEIELPMAVHIAESEAETRLVRDAEGPFAAALRKRDIPVVPRAASPIALLERVGVLARRPLLIHAVRLEEGDADRIVRTECSVAHCPISNVTLGHGVAPVLDLLSRGVAVGLGSDSMASNNRMDILEEARTATTMQRARGGAHEALSAHRALALATIDGARALGLAERIGSLEVGKDADLAAFDVRKAARAADLDPAAALVYGTAGEPARTVLVAGEERVRDWALLEDDAGRRARVGETEVALGEWKERRAGRPT